MPLTRFSSFNASLRSRTASPPDMRPYQHACLGLGQSNARRLLKRSQLSKKARREPLEPDERNFTLHEAAAFEAAAAAAAIAAYAAAQPVHRPPAATGYSVKCYATHAEDEAKRKDTALIEKEKTALFTSINSSRHAEGKHPLRLCPLLTRHAQDHADTLFKEDTLHTASFYPPSSTDSNPPPTSTDNTSHPTPNQVVVVMTPSGARSARLVSPPRMGALACGELWYGGKYKRHLFAMEARGGVGAPHAYAHTPEHHAADDCPCHLRIVFETMVDEGWGAMGIGRGEDGRWVVELGQ